MSDDAPNATAEQVYGRYHTIVPDWDAFLESLTRPLAPTVWPHPARISRDGLRRLLAEAGVGSTPVPWHPSALRLPEGVGAGGHWGYFAGLYQSQEAVATVPVMLLDPVPGERVLDMCAAPGNKTAQIALAMGNRGTVHANEVQRGRLSPLQGTIRRLGLINVSITLRPGEDLALSNGPFDRVLVDAPCSGEGIWRKVVGERAMKHFQVADAAMRERLAARQRRLLARAVRLARVGGRIVYSTCTVAPEENEAVVDAVLRAFPGQLAVRPARLPGFECSPGVTEWAGAGFDPSLAGAARVWPHQNDTGGFFAAVLEKVDGPEPDGALISPEGADDAALDALGRTFGLGGDAFDGVITHRGGGRYLSAVSADHRLPPGLATQTTGLPVLGTQARPPKPTTAFALAWAPAAQANILDVDEEGLAEYIARRPLYLDRVELPEAPYVLVRHGGHGIGVAHVRGRQADGRVAFASLHPKAWAGR
ncbi:RsmB/NOP family class I SAM-dependent RNA methyltransferase [Arhodomonas aquaeolei]|uniref:RsmB/NOP family class I SAM-dependent RNA methyltransferase n=1 Tax=Arhodomonas aquaeolei TaxID=2369 RepID=UPI0021675B77|nr:RsmB/NOP family class I SAM-dependent RNA methyltransferase [Arhodomonas aquaeolei]MCS4502648.1 RsmB/NOP family class I SAM-dependent RNA methyltransferase [Arhodomonas aquaeolei]